MPPPRIKLALFGAFGAILPDVTNLYAKRMTMPAFEFTTSVHIVATLLYLVTAAVVASIYPYKGKATLWRAAVVGFTLPLIVGTASSAIRHAGEAPAPLITRGPDPVVQGRLIDRLAYF